MVLISCCAWALEGDEADGLERLARAGLRSVDVRPSMLRGAEVEARRRDLGLRVSCVAASHEMPAGAAFDSDDPAAVESACLHVEDALDHAAALGAPWAYVVPEAPRDAASVERYDSRA